jgi:hypothetical protein
VNKPLSVLFFAAIAIPASFALQTEPQALADREITGISSTWYASDGADITRVDPVRAAALLKSYPFPSGYGAAILETAPAFPAPTDPYFNWADRNGLDWLTPIRNQGGCGSCFVFGSVSVMEALFKIAVGDWNYNPDLSEQKAISCIALGSCSSGGTAEEVALHLKSEGIPDELCFPYTSGKTGADGNCADKCSDWQSRASKITNWSMSLLPPSVDTLKAQIQTGPVIANLQVYSDFYSYSGGVYSRNAGASAQGWHIVTLAGWDDSDNSWIIKNSWDTDWGVNGYGKLSRTADCNLITQTGLCFASHTTTLTVDPAEAPSAPCTDPKALSVETWVGETSLDVHIQLKNCGKKGSFAWTGNVSVGSLSKASGTLAAQAVQAITVTLNPSILGTGKKTVSAKFKSGTMEALTAIEADVQAKIPADAGVPDAGQDGGGVKDGGADGGAAGDSGAVTDSGAQADSGQIDSGTAADASAQSDQGMYDYDFGHDSSVADSGNTGDTGEDGGQAGDSGGGDGQAEDSGGTPAENSSGCSCSISL